MILNGTKEVAKLLHRPCVSDVEKGETEVLVVGRLLTSACTDVHQAGAELEEEGNAFRALLEVVRKVGTRGGSTEINLNHVELSGWKMGGYIDIATASGAMECTEGQEGRRGPCGPDVADGERDSVRQGSVERVG
jgi:hypothetical protein